MLFLLLSTGDLVLLNGSGGSESGEVLQSWALDTQLLVMESKIFKDVITFIAYTCEGVVRYGLISPVPCHDKPDYRYETDGSRCDFRPGEVSGMSKGA